MACAGARTRATSWPYGPNVTPKGSPRCRETSSAGPAFFPLDGCDDTSPRPSPAACRRAAAARRSPGAVRRTPPQRPLPPRLPDQDRALYSCELRLRLQGEVTTSVGCPHCGRRRPGRLGHRRPDRHRPRPSRGLRLGVHRRDPAPPRRAGPRALRPCTPWAPRSRATTADVLAVVGELHDVPFERGRPARLHRAQARRAPRPRADARGQGRIGPAPPRADAAARGRSRAGSRTRCRARGRCPWRRSRRAPRPPLPHGTAR